MDINLKTNQEKESLGFCNAERFSDGSGFGAVLVVHSRGFSVEIPFYFETQPLEEFVKQLEIMNSSLKGKAKLKPLFEEHFVELELDNLGHVRVRGEMMEYSHMAQSLKFEFETDQTCLEPLILDLRQWREMTT